MVTADGTRRLWDVLRRRRPVWRDPATRIVYLAHGREAIESARDGVLSKDTVRELMSDRFSGSDWLRTVGNSVLVLQDGDEHRRLRHALDAVWVAGGRERIEGQIVRELLRFVARSSELNPDEFAEIVVDVVLSALFGRECPPDVLGELRWIAPRLNGLVAGDDEAATEFTNRLDSLCEALVDWQGSSGSVPTVLTQMGLSTADVVGVSVFVAAAAVETLRAGTMLCLRAATNTLTERPTAVVLMDDVPIVPYAFYGVTRSVNIADEHLEIGDLVAICLATEPGEARRLGFGFGAHHCFGARLSTLVASTLLGALPTQPERGWVWRTDRFTWSLLHVGPEG